MIYKQDANFPYPLLTNTSTSYEKSHFHLDVQLQENIKDYHFQIEYEIDSAFITHLLDTRQAQCILVIQSKDSKFFKLSPYQRNVMIPKSRISISSRTTIQLHIQSLADITFASNEDLSPFYEQFKEEIKVPKYALLGFSNVVVFDGSMKKPMDLFEKKIDPTLTSDIKIELSNETIVIHYKKEESQFNHLPMSNTLNNPYVYMGLQKALQQFIVENGDGEQVDLSDMEEPVNALDAKLYYLLKNKMIDEVHVDNLDEVIYKISDRILERYTEAVRGLHANGS